MSIAGVAARVRTPSRAALRLRLQRPAAVAVGLGAAGLLYRLAMLLAQVPPTNSDEATMGLAALHIASGRELPIFFYGQHYMGTIEAYLAAPLIALGGPDTLALRLPNLAWYTVFLTIMWLLTRRLFTPWLATFTVGLLALGSDRILKNQLIAAGGYPEISPAGALLMLIAVGLGLNVTRRRVAAYGCWGLVAGLLLWDDWLILPYVFASAFVLFVAARPVDGGRAELRGRAGLAVLVGVLIGAAPLIVHDLTGPLRNTSFAAFIELNGGGAGWGERLRGGLLFGLPMGTGMCSPSHCAPWQLWWGVAYPVLLVAASVLAWRGLRREAGAETDEGVHSARVVQAGRLALAVAAALTILAYVRSGAAAHTPVESARYLSGLLISTPLVLWPLWRVVASATRSSAVPSPARPWAVLAALPLVALLVTAVVATAGAISHASVAGQRADQRAELVAALDRLGVTRLYSEYWTCNVVTYASGERMICAVLDDDLRPGKDRYLPYREAVARAPNPAYVAPSGSALSTATAARLRAAGVESARHVVAGYDIYLPQRRLVPGG